MNRYRRPLLLLAFVILVATLGMAIYFVFFQQPPTTTPEKLEGTLPAGTLTPSGANTGANGRPNGTTGNTTLPAASPVANGGLTVAKTLVSTVVSDPALSADGSSLHYYDRLSGAFFRVDPNTGRSTQLISKAFPGVEKTTWSPDGVEKAILQFPDGKKIFFDFETQKQVTLPDHWKDFSWSSNGSEVAAKSIGIDENNRYLIVANPDGSNARPVAALGANEAKVIVDYSPNNQVIAFAKTGDPQKLGVEQIFGIGKNQENYPALSVQGVNFLPEWSPSGSEVLYSVANADNDWKPGLWVVNGQGDTLGQSRKKIGLNTWADKCTFATDDIAYCAAPRDLPTGASFQRSVANDAIDDVYRVDLRTGTYRLIATPESPSAIQKVMVTKDGNTLLYTELQTGALRSIKLH